MHLHIALAHMYARRYGGLHMLPLPTHAITDVQKKNKPHTWNERCQSIWTCRLLRVSIIRGGWRRHSDKAAIKQESEEGKGDGGGDESRSACWLVYSLCPEACFNLSVHYTRQAHKHSFFPIFLSRLLPSLPPTHRLCFHALWCFGQRELTHPQLFLSPSHPILSLHCAEK